MKTDEHFPDFDHQSVFDPSIASVPTEVQVSESNVIVEGLSEEAQHKLTVIQTLIEPCDRATYGEKLRDAAEKLGCSVRTVQRLVKRWEVEGVAAFADSGRSDRGKHRISEFWQTFIIKTYEVGNKGSKRMKPKQVAVRVQAKAREIGDDQPPSYKTVLRVLQPIIERKEIGKLSGEDFVKTVKMWEQKVLKLPVASNLTSKTM